MDPNQNPNQNQNNFNDAVNNFTNTPDATNQFDPADIEKNKTMAILSYLGFLFLVPLLAAKDSPFAKFHANQGLVLFIFDIIVTVVSTILGILPFIGWLISLLLYAVVLVFVILGIINAAGGKAKQLPIIGGITILK